MSTTQEKRQQLAFPSPGAYTSFLLTCLEEPDLGKGSEIYEQHLSRVFVPRSGKQTLHVPVRGDAELVQQVVHMALANGGTAQDGTPLEKSKHLMLTVPQLLRAVRLQHETMDSAGCNHVLVALYRSDTDKLGEFLRFVWALGPHMVEVAFVRSREQAVPSHFVRVLGLRHSDAFSAWCRSNTERFEVYTPVRNDRRGSRCYTLWGYRHPVPGLEQLAELDRELILLRPAHGKTPSATEWITFSPGVVNFFRKAYEFADLEIDLNDVPLVELDEDSQAARVPLRLELMKKPVSGPSPLLQLDKEIDRQRRELIGLEQTRAQLKAGQHDEFYFAYSFEQDGTDELNPLLIQLLHQRVGTLNHYEYAFCKTKRGKPYHLVIANRTQRQLGFSLQLADRTYYQPAVWRRWGVNLYIPLNMELAPRIDDANALPILQRILERSDEVHDGQEPPSIAALEAAAVLWDPGVDGEIQETRVSRTSSLLSQFRLLNGFQRRVAGRVAEATCQRLNDHVRESRQHIDQDLDGLTQDLLAHVSQRAARLETVYAEFDQAIASAQHLIDVLQPHVQEVRERILVLPDEWIKFVDHVIDLHRAAAEPELLASDQFRREWHVGRRELRALAARGRQLGATAASQRAAVEQQIAECEAALGVNTQTERQLEELGQRANHVFVEVQKMHRRLGSRLARADRLEREAEQMRQEIDEIGRREAEVQHRLDEVKRVYQEFQNKAAAVENQNRDVEAREQALAKKVTDMAQRREELCQRHQQVDRQIERIEHHLRRYADRAGELERNSAALQEEMVLVDSHADAIAMWETQERNWREHIEQRQADARARVEQLRQAMAELRERESEADSAQSHLRVAEEQLDKAKQLLSNKGIASNI